MNEPTNLPPTDPDLPTSDPDRSRLINALPSSEVAERGVQKLVNVTQVKYEGPLPPPGTLEAFGKINATFPDRIMRMAEENAATERLTAIRAQTFQLTEEVLGRILGFAFASASALGAVYLAVQGHETVASVLFGGTATVVTVALIKGRHTN